LPGSGVIQPAPAPAPAPAPTPVSPDRNTIPGSGVAIGHGNATLSWNPPTERTDGSRLTLAGYRIVYGTSSRIYRYSVRLTNPGLMRYFIDGLTSGTWYFAIIAIDQNGRESAPSAEVRKRI
jgi:hypothetical protein